MDFMSILEREVTWSFPQDYEGVVRVRLMDCMFQEVNVTLMRKKHPYKEDYVWVLPGCEAYYIEVVHDLMAVGHDPDNLKYVRVTYYSVQLPNTNVKNYTEDVGSFMDIFMALNAIKAAYASQEFKKTRLVGKEVK
jgi:hypothetical protein